MTVGLTLLPYLVAALMDMFSISVHSATGWDLGRGFVQNTLGSWPGGKVVAAIMLNQHPSLPTVIAGTLQVLVVAACRSCVPSFKIGGVGFSIKGLLAGGLLDFLITCLISIAVGVAFTLWLNKMFEGVTASLAQAIVGFGEIIVIAACVLVALKVLQHGDVIFAFRIVTAIGRFAITTFALITWSLNNIVGALTVVLCIIACGVLAFVDQKAADRW